MWSVLEMKCLLDQTVNQANFEANLVNLLAEFPSEISECFYAAFHVRQTYPAMRKESGPRKQLFMPFHSALAAPWQCKALQKPACCVKHHSRQVEQKCKILWRHLKASYFPERANTLMDWREERSCYIHRVLAVSHSAWAFFKMWKGSPL